MMNLTQNNNNDDEEKPASFTLVERSAMAVARWPKTSLSFSLSLCLLCSVLGMYFGDFSVSVDQKGWMSRGTTVANRHQQASMVRRNRQELHDGDAASWDDLTQNVQVSWEAKKNGRRLLSSSTTRTSSDQGMVTNDVKPMFHRRLVELQQDGNETDELLSLVEHCDLDLYTDYGARRLWPKWQVKKSRASALDPDVLHDLCQAEENTQKVLEERGLCEGCGDYGCLPPYSIVLYARLKVPQGFSMTCRDLADSWAPYQSETEKRWQQCVTEIAASGVAIEDPLPASCETGFTAALVDTDFQSTGRVAYTSSVFMTKGDKKEELFEISGLYDRGSDSIGGAFDTQHEDFVIMYANEALPQDMILAVGSAIITTVAVLVHTRSPFLTFIGSVQILLSFPMAFCIYRFLGQLTYFPFLNFVGIFVVFALGADHIFVAVDKWKNVRIERPGATTEEVAAKALPDAASAMFLTTITTAVAFFGSAICPVAPVKLFSIFCGLLISIDFVMDVLILFPAICVYDQYRASQNYLISLDTCKSRSRDGIRNVESVAQGSSLIHRFLSRYYGLLHKFRWFLLVACIAAIGVCSFCATKLKQPVSNDLRVLRSGIEVEQAHDWKGKLLLDTLQKQSGGRAYVVFGVTSADTGNYNNPESSTQLVLDETFQPSKPEVQVFLRDYCDRFLAQEFAVKTEDGYVCAINRFDNWLKEQSALEAPDETYQAYCTGETSVPLSEGAFHPCVSAWAQKVNELFISSRDGVVKIVHFPFTGNARHDSPNSVLQDEWNSIEDWMQHDNASAPAGVSNAFFSSGDFWYWDTNYQMFTTAVSSAGIAIAAAAVVILLSSRSIAMTIFSVISVGYVLASVTSMMVAVGWQFGLLESICFTILIGVSVDFVIHFSHAYAEQPGQVSRNERTKYALIHMGPSILAAGFTTLASATIMLFTDILFFQLFATVMSFTIIQATIGSFVVFLTLTEILGPSNPTFLFDWINSKCHNGKTEAANYFATAGITVAAMTDDDSLPSSSSSDEESSLGGIPEEVTLMEISV